MTPQDRRILSDEFLTRSDAEFNPRGNDQIAAEILWGAAAQLLLIEIHGEPTLNFRDHGSYRDAAILLQARSTGSVVLTDFECANKLHGHFYHGHLSDHDLRSCRRITKRFIRRLGAYLDQSAQTSQPHAT